MTLTPRQCSISCSCSYIIECQPVINKQRTHTHTHILVVGALRVFFSCVTVGPTKEVREKKNSIDGHRCLPRHTHTRDKWKHVQLVAHNTHTHTQLVCVSSINISIASIASIVNWAPKRESGESHSSLSSTYNVLDLVACSAVCWSS